MGKFSSGPDWTDVEQTMRIMEELHEGRVSLRISPAGRGSSGGFDTDLSILWDVLPGSEDLRSLSIQGPWPCKDCTTLAQHIWKGLLMLDTAVLAHAEQGKSPT